jgi:VanZ family protein
VVQRALEVVAVAWAVLVIVLSLVPDDPSADVAWDKFCHAGAYAVLMVLGLMVLRGRGRGRVRGRSATVVGVAIVALGGVIEVLQAKVVDRDGSFGDLLADAIGVAAGAVVFRVLAILDRRRRRRRHDLGLSVESRANPRQ